MTLDILNEKYRPSEFSQIVGQDKAMLKSLADTVEQCKSHCFLFSGPSGCGKTTAARIVAHKLETSNTSLHEIDAASTNSVEEMRGLVETMRHTGLGGENRVAILDECHMLSSQARQVLLKPMEDAIPTSFWILCTTDLKKVLPTIMTRASHYEFKSINMLDLYKLIERIAVGENITITHNIINAITHKAEGSARKAVVLLSQISAQSEDEAGIIKFIQNDAGQGTKAVLDLCRFLINSNPSFEQVVPLIKEITTDGNTYEGAASAIAGYASAVLMNNPTSQTAIKCLYAFSSPLSYQPYTKASFIQRIVHITSHS